ncbi:MAG: O-antigen ligase family protein [Anaerolineales bacterium]|nr:O-antigen ligase family protein [Anaerolineales bacterium]
MVKAAIIAALYAPLLRQVLNNRYIQLLPDIIFVLILTILILHNLIKYPSRQSSQVIRLRWAAYLFLTISIIQIFNPNIPSLSLGLEGFRKTSLYLIALVVGTYLNWDEKTIRSLFRFVLIAAMPICLYAFKQIFFPSSFDALMAARNNAGISTLTIFGRSRATSFFSSPFTLGYFGNTIFAIGMFFYANEKKWIYLLTAALGAGSVFLSGTRINLVALIVVFLLIFMLFFFTIRRFYVFLRLALFLVPAFVYAYNSPVVGPLFQSLSPDRILADQRFLGRFEVYDYAFEKLKDNWFWGYGMGSAGDTLGVYFTKGEFITSHNMFIKVYFETGLLGLFAFIAIWVIWLLGNRRSALRAQADGLRTIYHLGLIASSVLFINGLSGGALDSFPANVITFLFMGVTYNSYGSREFSASRRMG